jgi:hypothetical protein
MSEKVKSEEIQKLKDDIQNKYKINFNDKLIKCRLCDCFVRADGYEKHKESKKHKKLKVGKYCVNSNGKDYYYEHSKKSDASKKYHANYIRRKISCRHCGAVVGYSAQWRHYKSMKCLTARN